MKAIYRNTPLNIQMKMHFDGSALFNIPSVLTDTSAGGQMDIQGRIQEF